MRTLTDVTPETDTTSAVDVTLAADTTPDTGTTAADVVVGFRVIDSPIGRLLLAGSDAGLCRVAFEGEDHHAVLADVARRLGARVQPDSGALDEVASELERYFAGTGREFRAPVDLRLTSGFRRTALERLREIPYGERIGYGELAALAGHPRAARAVGTACATNPVPIVVPCHRVVRADGSFGAYGGGTDVKRYLLDLEARHTA